MSNYVNDNLMPNETVIIRGKIHWFAFVPGGFLFLIGLISVVATKSPLGSIFILIGLVMLVKAFISYISTELAVTSKRVIAKFGFIRRSTIELNHKNVESFNVDQSIPGRLLNFGTVRINGTGGIRTPIPRIANPLEFRKVALTTIEPE
jgi:uncharacterized membrane protein YdbT with pleckstrin-like domain